MYSFCSRVSSTKETPKQTLGKNRYTFGMISLDSLPFAAQIHPEARPAQHLTWDSRKVDTDTAFVALAGENMHGDRFVQQALEAGAPFVLTGLDVPRAVRVPDAWQALKIWAQHRRAQNPQVVGITGSAGKTTTKAYVAAALNAHYMPVFNTMPAIACFLIEFGASARPLVVEMGIDRLGEMHELMELVRPDVGVITSIGPAHLEQLQSVENIAREKGVILQAPRGAYMTLQAADFYPEHSGHSEHTQHHARQAISYGFEGAQIPAHHLQLGTQGATFEFVGQRIELPFAARVQAEAAVLGLILAQAAGLHLTEAIDRVQKVRVPDGRYRVHHAYHAHQRHITVIDDAYNASPIAVKASLDALSAFEGRKISVLGRMLELGATERELHAEVGAYAREKTDLSYGVGAFASELGERAYTNVTDLIAALRADLREGDVVLVKASRGLSFGPEQRDAEGVGLETVVSALLEHVDE